MSTNTKLAEALRDVEEQARHPDYDWPLWLSQEVSAALAAHDAEQAPACIYPACQHNGCTETCKRRAVPMMPEQASQAVPAGWKLVPVEPTPEILAAIWAYKLDSLKDCYRALLAAAPAAPAPEAQADEPALLAEIDRLRRNLRSVWRKAEEAAERRGLKLVMQMPEGRVELLEATPAPQAQAAGQEAGPGIDTLAAVSAALAQRQPLTDEQITKMIGEYWGRYEFARAIERAHGIKEQQHG